MTTPRYSRTGRLNWTSDSNLSVTWKMKNDQCSGEAVDVAEEEEGRLSLNDLPDEILILIFNRLFDLKCLCSCFLVSSRFSSLILLHVQSVSFSVPRRTVPIPDNTAATDTLSHKFLRFFFNGIVAKPLHFFRQFVYPTKPLPPMISSFYGDSFRSAIYFLSKFKSIRSLHLVLPSFPYKGNPNPNDDSLFFKWTAKFGPTIDTFVFLSPSSIRVGRNFDLDDQQLLDSQLTTELLKHRVHLAFQCLKDAIVRHRMLLFFIEEHPLLQNITITDSKNQGRLSLRNSKLVEMRNWINSSSLAVKSELKRIEVPVNAQQWHVPMLKLPVSGKEMVNATLVLMEMVDRGHLGRDWGGDAAAIAHLFEPGDDDEPFSEAIVEIMVNHSSRINILL